MKIRFQTPNLSLIREKVQIMEKNENLKNQINFTFKKNIKKYKKKIKIIFTFNLFFDVQKLIISKFKL